MQLYIPDTTNCIRCALQRTQGHLVRRMNTASTAEHEQLRQQEEYLFGAQGGVLTALASTDHLHLQLQAEAAAANNQVYI